MNYNRILQVHLIKNIHSVQWQKKKTRLLRGTIESAIEKLWRTKEVHDGLQLLVQLRHRQPLSPLQLTAETWAQKDKLQDDRIQHAILGGEKYHVIKTNRLGYDVNGLKRAAADEAMSIVKVLLSRESDRQTTCSGPISDPLRTRFLRANWAKPRASKRWGLERRKSCHAAVFRIQAQDPADGL